MAILPRAAARGLTALIKERITEAVRLSNAAKNVKEFCNIPLERRARGKSICTNGEETRDESALHGVLGGSADPGVE